VFGLLAAGRQLISLLELVEAIGGEGRFVWQN